MKLLAAILLTVFFNAATCFAACTEATQTSTLTFTMVTQGASGTYVISPTDPGAAEVVVSGETQGANITPSVADNGGKICLQSTSTCLTVGAHTVSPNVPTPAGADGKVTVKIGATVTVNPDSPAGTYTGTPSKAVFTCQE